MPNAGFSSYSSTLGGSACGGGAGVPNLVAPPNLLPPGGPNFGFSGSFSSSAAGAAAAAALLPTFNPGNLDFGASGSFSAGAAAGYAAGWPNLFKGNFFTSGAASSYLDSLMDAFDAEEFIFFAFKAPANVLGGADPNLEASEPLDPVDAAGAGSAI